MSVHSACDGYEARFEASRRTLSAYLFGLPFPFGAFGL
jgi:hypothetical protein